jgi:predicted MFS family arabinose efflux permease
VTIPEQWRRHLAQALAIMAITTASGSGTTLLSPLLREQGKDPVAIGALVGVPAIVSLLIRIPGGLLYSQRRARPLLGLAVCLGALGFVLYPVTTDALVLVFVGAIYGVGYSIATTVSMALAIESLRPGDNRGQALGIYAAGMSTGYAVGSLVGGISGDSLGYTGAFRLAAVLFLVAMLPMLLDRSEPPPLERSAAGSAAQLVGWRRATSFAGLLLDPVLMFIILGAFFLNVYLTQFNTFLPLTMLPLGFTLAQIGLVRTAWSLTNTLGRSFGGPVLNWLGHHRAQHSSLVLQAGMLMLLALPLPLPAYIGVTVMAASGRAICFVANTVALADIDPTRVSRGVASGVMNAAGDLGNIAGPVTGGFIARAVGLQSFWLISPPLYLAIYFGLLLALRRREQVQSVPAAV